MPSISILAYKRFKWHLPIRPSRLLSNKFSIIKKEGGPVLIWKTRDMDKEKIIYKKINVTRHVLTHLNIPFEPVETLYMFINTSLRCHDVMISSLVWIDIL